MAQTGFTPIKLYSSTTPAATPTAGNLEQGELAINTNDGKLFYEDSSGVVQVIATKAGSLGDVVGPASATDNAIVRYDGTTGKLIQNSAVTIDDSNNVSGVAQLNATTVAATTGNITTVNATTVNATTVDTTNIEVTNLKAKDGTAAATIADSTGVVTISTQLNVDNLRLDGNTVSSTDTNGNIDLTPDGVGEVNITKVDIDSGTIDNTTIGASTPSTVVATQVDIVAQGDLRLQDTTGGQFVALQAPGTIATSYTLTLPIDDGISGQALITDGVGVLAWSYAGVGDVVGPASSTDNAIARFDGTTGEILQDSTVTIGDDGATNIAGNLTIGGTITVTANPVVQQSDIGTAPNEIPLNQYLGALAYQGNEVITYLQNQINALYAAVYSLLPVSVNFVSLQDCVFEGTAKQPIGVAVNSTNSGNNLGWTFV